MAKSIFSRFSHSTSLLQIYWHRVQFPNFLRNIWNECKSGSATRSIKIGVTRLCRSVAPTSWPCDGGLARHGIGPSPYGALFRIQWLSSCLLCQHNSFSEGSCCETQPENLPSGRDLASVRFLTCHQLRCRLALHQIQRVSCEQREEVYLNECGEFFLQLECLRYLSEA